MKNIIITGGNGMIGSLILKKCLDHKDVNKVTSIVRRKTGIVHPKLNEIIHTDFLNYSTIKENFLNQQVCFYCLGVYTGQVLKEEFHKITIDFTRAFAEELRRGNDGLTFCFLSGQGADSYEKRRIMFARDKGIAENILINLSFKNTLMFRPGYIYPVTPRKEPNILYRIMRMFYKIFSRIYPNLGVTSEKLAETMVDAAFNVESSIIYENSMIRLYKNKNRDK